MIASNRTRLLSSHACAATPGRGYLKASRILPAAAALILAGAPAFAVAASPNDDLAAGVKTLSLAELQSQVTSQGITVTEMKVDGLILEVEGYDANGREIELKLDRRSGETLSKKFDD